MPSADLVVLGATLPGIIAAEAAVQRGRTVYVLEPSNHIGGMVTGGLSRADYSTGVNWGNNIDFFNRCAAKYGIAPPSINNEPSVASSVVSDILSAYPAIVIIKGQQLVSVAKFAARISSITVSGGTYSAAQFIDCTYEGDLAAMSGCTMSYGRDATSTYNETKAGFVGNEAIVHTSPVVDGNGNRLSFIGPTPPSAEGGADLRSQAFAFRLCFTNASSRIAWPMPPAYNRNDFLALLNYVTKFGNTDFAATVGGGTLQNPAKLDMNWVIFGGDYPGPCSGWGAASYAGRAAVAAQYYYQQAGALYFLANDSAVNATLQAGAQSYGLCADEFQTDYYQTPGWSPLLYPREVRRLVGRAVLTSTSIYSPKNKTQPDPICLGGYPIDSHQVNQYATSTGGFLFEGAPSLTPPPLYQIPFRSLQPDPRQVSNLLVPVCASTSRLVYCSYRVEPTMMAAAESAAIASSMCVERGLDPYQLPYADLRAELLAVGAILN